MTPTDPFRPRADLSAVIAVGGALGSLGRWGVAELLPDRAAELPWSVLLVNVTGSLLLGVLAALMLTVWRDVRYVRPFLGVGVLGGYTTFSTYALDGHDLLAAGRPAAALAYLAGSVVAGLVAVAVGLSLTLRVVGTPEADS
ncbi:MAG TPA: fluoride efflux transporter CrcB [Nocardioides sp.]|uniref:fluoride efflux transporter CrcB n=1 Tax=Nocardioides sp. TaxID=35761 RepID=UPI002EDBB66E